MNVIWKRPDGYHGASPEDYIVVDVASQSRIWLHRRDQDNFPFRVSGGWQDEAQTHRLNQLINRLDQPLDKWVEHLTSTYEHSDAAEPAAFLRELTNWLTSLHASCKGDTWELEIMTLVLNEIRRQIDACSQAFLTRLGQLGSDPMPARVEGSLAPKKPSP